MFTDFSRAHAIRIMENLANHPCAKLFLYPVNSIEGAQDYYQIIKKPMDITSIINNLLNGRYKTFLEWKRDIHLISQNSKTYNGESSYITALALQLVAHFDSEFRSFYAYDQNLWQKEFLRVSNKLDSMISEGNLNQSSTALQDAIETSQRGHKLYESLLHPICQNPSQILNEPIQKDGNFQLSISKSEIKDEFDSPPEISGETQNPQQQNTFELLTSNTLINQSQINQQSSIFEGIDVQDLPPQIILSQPNDSSSPPNPPPSSPKQKMPSIFGNIQFEAFPPTFGSNQSALPENLLKIGDTQNTNSPFNFSYQQNLYQNNPNLAFSARDGPRNVPVMGAYNTNYNRIKKVDPNDNSGCIDVSDCF